MQVLHVYFLTQLSQHTTNSGWQPRKTTRRLLQTYSGKEQWQRRKWFILASATVLTPSDVISFNSFNNPEASSLLQIKGTWDLFGEATGSSAQCQECCQRSVPDRGSSGNCSLGWLPVLGPGTVIRPLLLHKHCLVRSSHGPRGGNPFYRWRSQGPRALRMLLSRPGWCDCAAGAALGARGLGSRLRRLRRVRPQTPCFPEGPGAGAAGSRPTPPKPSSPQPAGRATVLPSESAAPASGPGVPREDACGCHSTENLPRVRPQTFMRHV